MGQQNMVDWKTIKCTQCKSHKYCRKHNIAKGSTSCKVNLKLISKPKVETISKKSASHALLWGLMQQAKK